MILILISIQQLISLSIARKQLHSASLFIRFSNGSSRSLMPLIYFYIRGSNLFNFSKTTINLVSGTNATVTPIEDGSGIRLYLENFRPLTSVEFQVNNIEMVQIKSDTLSDTEVIADYNYVNATDVSYDAVFSLYGKIGVYDLSIASIHTFTDKFDGTAIYRTQHRAEVLNYLIIFYVILLGAGLLISISFIAPKLTFRLPFVTLIIIEASVFLYVFVGSGFEINFFPSKENFRLLFPMAFLIHGSDQHINSNLLPYFTLLSLLFESWLLIRNKFSSLFWWYLAPLFADSVICGTWSFLTSGRFGFGLSLSIEAMTWTLWAYIIKNHEKILKRNYDVLFSILAGIPSVVFLGWLLNIVYNPVQTAYYQILTTNHVLYGSITMFIIFGAIFGKEIINRCVCILNLR
jgi:hypothetical protein